MVEEMKMVKIITSIGSEVSMLTRMLTAEIEKELMNDGGPEWITLSAFDGQENPVQFAILRRVVCGYFVGKAQRSQPQQAPSPIIPARGSLRGPIS